jgi:hypothetical protein
MRALAGVLLALFCAAAAAQLRTIPQDAVRGTMRHVQDMIVEIDGARAQLAPGAQIRSPSNRLVLPTAIPPGVTVRYKLDDAGQVNQVWMLTRREAAQPDSPAEPAGR